MSFEKYPHLFEPLIVSNTVFRNRIFSAPMGASFLDSDELPMPELAAHYERKALGGAASVALGSRTVDTEIGACSGSNPIPYGNYRGTAFFNYFTNSITRHGAIASVELVHGGCFSDRSFANGNQIYGPSEGIYKGTHVLPMSELIIEETIENFAKAAKWAKSVGFGMVTVHGGHGWLLTQFMSPVFNKRTDRWGGSVENRIRLAQEICKAIRRATGPDFVIEMRISGSECTPSGYDINEGIRLAKALDGYPDIIHVSAGSSAVNEKAHTFTVTHPSMFQEDATNLALAAAIKPHIKQSKVATVGALSDPAVLEEIIASGKADIVNLARGLIADPDLPNKARAGNEKDINECMRCFACFSHVMSSGQFYCTLNPQIGHDIEYINAPTAPKAKKNVLIIGGGIGGMQAALTASERGHDVTLCEKADDLGGILRCEENVDFKTKLTQYVKRQADRVKRSNIKLLLGTEMTPDAAKAGKHDIIISAIGSKQIVPGIDGIDGENVLGAVEAHGQVDKIGQRVAIIGGGLVGAELGIHLKRLGREVEIIEMTNAVNSADNFLHGNALDAELDLLGISVRLGTKAERIAKNGVAVTSAEGDAFIEADTVIYAVGMQGLQEQAAAFAQCAPITYQIGDCSRPANILEANRLGYNVAMDLGKFF